LPFDGIVTKCVVDELSHLLTGGRIEKIYQPEADEIILNIRAGSHNVKLLLSASANYPRIHITDSVRENPAVPPVFCMLLRKHLSGGKITGFGFHDYERIVTIFIESLSELGDITEKKLIIEIMGRYSNIILTTGDDKIIDAAKHVDEEVSSVREVMPARPYVFPPAQDKISPEAVDGTIFEINTHNSCILK
jgi:predicted ribosome quality control (RQC) complex YloA/Tae2 family protein